MESHVPIPSFGHFKTPPETDLCVCRLLQPSLGTSFGGAMSPACTRPQHTQLKHLVLLVLPHVALKELLCACAQGHTPHLLLTALFPASCGQQFEGGNKGEFPGPPKKTLRAYLKASLPALQPQPSEAGYQQQADSFQPMMEALWGLCFESHQGSSAGADTAPVPDQQCACGRLDIRLAITTALAALKGAKSHFGCST